jgi:hypothetical protein
VLLLLLLFALKASPMETQLQAKPEQFSTLDVGVIVYAMQSHLTKTA